MDSMCTVACTRDYSMWSNIFFFFFSHMPFSNFHETKIALLCSNASFFIRKHIEFWRWWCRLHATWMNLIPISVHAVKCVHCFALMLTWILTTYICLLWFRVSITQYQFAKRNNGLSRFSNSWSTKILHTTKRYAHVFGIVRPKIQCIRPCKVWAICDSCATVWWWGSMGNHCSWPADEHISYVHFWFGHRV